MSTKDDPTETFGTWLGRQIRRREWTAADFARQMGSRTSNGTVSQWLNDRRVPSPGSCDRIADVLAIDVDVVLAKAGHRPPVFDIDPDSPEGQFVPIIRQIEWTDRDIASFKAQLEAMAKQWPKKKENA